MTTNKEKQLNQRARRALRKLPKTRKMILYLELSFRVFIYELRSKIRRIRPRARAHWLGGNRPRRLERALIFTVILGAVPVLEFDQYLLWCAAWGGGAAVFINLNAASKLIPRKRYHWAGR